MGCTVNDIARRAGVSRSTVLRALSDKPDISAHTRSRIRELASEMRYRPNYVARSLTHGRTNLVGVLAKPSIYYASHLVIEAVVRGLREGGYATMLFVSGRESGTDESLVEQLMKSQVDGVIAVPGAMTPPSTYQELLDANIKLVTLDGVIDDLAAPQIVGDNYKAGLLGARHLIALGHRRIACLGIPKVSNVGRERNRGIRDAFREAGLRVDEKLFVDIDFNEKEAEECTSELLTRHRPPTAMLVRHDVTARGAMRAVYAAGLSIPEDISIVGNGDILGSDMFRVPLTTVRFPARRMADCCVRTLLDMLAGQAVDPSTTLFDVDLVVRASSAPPASA